MFQEDHTMLHYLKMLSSEGKAKHEFKSYDLYKSVICSVDSSNQCENVR